MPAVTIYHSDGSTETIPATVGWKKREELQQMWRLKITVERSQAQAVSLTRKQDEVELSGVKRGVLTDIDNGGTTWTLTVRSPEWYATQQAPTLGGDKREGDDNSLLTTLIGEVPQWSVGTVADLTGPMTYVFNHAFANEAMRKIEKNVPGELQWSGDGTVDYLDALGTDKSGSVTLSPDEGNLENEIQIQDKGRKFDATHLRVIGAHEGEAQRFAQLVPDADPQTYENEVRYTQPRWSDSSDTDWERWENKDVVAQDTIQEEAEALAPELTETYVEATATVSGEDLSVGDYVRVVKDDADLDRTMRIHRITTRTKQDTTAAVVDEVQLSTRTTVRDSPSDMGRDIQRFNTGFQGSSVAVNGGPIIAAVDSGNPLTIPFPYPALEFENSAEIIVQGLPYRIDSVPNEHAHTVDVTHPSHSHDVTHPSHSHGVNGTTDSSPASSSLFGRGDSNYSTITIDSGSLTRLFDEVVSIDAPHFAIAGVHMKATSSTTRDVNVFIDGVNQDYPPSDVVMEVSGDGTSTFSCLIPGDDIPFDFGAGGHEIDVLAQAVGSDVEVEVAGFTVGIDNHTHGVSETSETALGNTETSETALGTTESVTSTTAAGITEGIYQTGDTPSNVDVAINGTEVATDIGSGQFEATIDVAGEFTVGQTNDITISSDSLGRVLVTPFIRGYDQIGTRD